MATAAALAPRDIPTTLNYYVPLDGSTEAPYSYVEPPADKPRTNVGGEPYPVTIRDARTAQEELTLDKNGFQFVKWPSVESEFRDDERIKEKYYPEVEELLKKVAGAKRVFIFDHTIRYV